VDGAGNSPGVAADAEVALDIQVVGSTAPGSEIIVYFAPNSTRGFYDAIAAAVHDAVRRPSIVSISWGTAESRWTGQAMDSYDALFADAAASGVTVFAACGDTGATDGVPDGGLHVDFPASSPHVVGCGGTRLTDGVETVWNNLAGGGGATGGGVSAHFARPGYQDNAGVPVGVDGRLMRGVPDVAGVADPATGYRIRVNATEVVVGGTSAVAPLWAGLTALVNARGGGASGFVQPRLYATSGALRDIEQGDNGGYAAGPGWDPCTGLGVPAGEATVSALQPART
jgi:kumamolisin